MSQERKKNVQGEDEKNPDPLRPQSTALRHVGSEEKTKQIIEDLGSRGEEIDVTDEINDNHKNDGGSTLDLKVEKVEIQQRLNLSPQKQARSPQNQQVSGSKIHPSDREYISKSKQKYLDQLTRGVRNSQLTNYSRSQGTQGGPANVVQRMNKNDYSVHKSASSNQLNKSVEGEGIRTSQESQTGGKVDAAVGNDERDSIGSLMIMDDGTAVINNDSQQLPQQHHQQTNQNNQTTLVNNSDEEEDQQQLLVDGDGVDEIGAKSTRILDMQKGETEIVAGPAGSGAQLQTSQKYEQKEPSSGEQATANGGQLIIEQKKHSVLVKRAKNDIQTATEAHGVTNNSSGLKNYRITQNFATKQDPKLLVTRPEVYSNLSAHQPGQPRRRPARNESNGAQGTYRSNDSEMRSTMYITGHSQRFAIGGASLIPGNSDINNLNSPKEGSYIINLGERTATEFHSKIGGQHANRGLKKTHSSRFELKNSQANSKSPDPIPERIKGLKNKIRPKRSLEHQPAYLQKHQSSTINNNSSQKELVSMVNTNSNLNANQKPTVVNFANVAVGQTTDGSMSRDGSNEHMLLGAGQNSNKKNEHFMKNKTPSLSILAIAPSKVNERASMQGHLLSPHHLKEFINEQQANNYNQFTIPGKILINQSSFQQLITTNSPENTSQNLKNQQVPSQVSLKQFDVNQILPQPPNNSNNQSMGATAALKVPAKRNSPIHIRSKKNLHLPSPQRSHDEGNPPVSTGYAAGQEPRSKGADTFAENTHPHSFGLNNIQNNIQINQTNQSYVMQQQQQQQLQQQIGGGSQQYRQKMNGSKHSSVDMQLFHQQQAQIYKKYLMQNEGSSHQQNDTSGGVIVESSPKNVNQHGSISTLFNNQRDSERKSPQLGKFQQISASSVSPNKKQQVQLAGVLNPQQQLLQRQSFTQQMVNFDRPYDRNVPSKTASMHQEYHQVQIGRNNQNRADTTKSFLQQHQLAVNVVARESKQIRGSPNGSSQFGLENLNLTEQQMEYILAQGAAGGSSQSPIRNSKMVSTYTGTDNMRLRIISSSVLKEDPKKKQNNVKMDMKSFMEHRKNLENERLEQARLKAIQNKNEAEMAPSENIENGQRVESMLETTELSVPFVENINTTIRPDEDVDSQKHALYKSYQSSQSRGTQMNNYDVGGALDGSDQHIMNLTGGNAKHHTSNQHHQYMNEQTINRINLQLLNSTDQAEHLIARNSPLQRLESYRNILQEAAGANSAVLQGNQESFAHLINPDVTKHGDYDIKRGSPNDLSFFIGPSQKAKEFGKDPEHLHSITKDFLKKKYNETTSSKGKQSFVSPPDSSHKRKQLFANVNTKQLKMRLQQAPPILRSDSSSNQEHQQILLQQQIANSLPFEMIGGDAIKVSNVQDLTRDPELGDTFMTFVNNQGVTIQQLSNKNPTTQQGSQSSKFQLNSLINSQVQSRQEYQSLPQSPTGDAEKGSKGERSLDFDTHNEKQIASTDPPSRAAHPTSQKSSPLRNIASGSLASSRNQGGGQSDRKKTSFAENTQFQSIQRLSTKKSQLGLASSSSSRKALRYMKEQKIIIFEDGAEMSSQTPCLVIELIALLKKFYVRQKGESVLTSDHEDIARQAEFYEYAVRQILDSCSELLVGKNELNPILKQKLDGRNAKSFNQLYTLYGQEVTSLLHIEEDVRFMVAGKKRQFEGLKINKLFEKDEEAASLFGRYFKRMPLESVQQSIDEQSDPHLLDEVNSVTSFEKQGTNVHRSLDQQYSARKKTLKRQANENSSPDKTFTLTQVANPIAPKSTRNLSQILPQDRGQRRHKSLTSRQIVDQGKLEVKEQERYSRNRVMKEALNSFKERQMGPLENKGQKYTRKQKQDEMDLLAYGLKRGKLPPIETPKELDYFIFGEQSEKFMKQALIDKLIRGGKNKSEAKVDDPNNESQSQQQNNTLQVKENSSINNEESSTLLKKTNQIHEHFDRLQESGKTRKKPQKLTEKNAHVGKAAITLKSPAYENDKLVSGLEKQDFQKIEEQPETQKLNKAQQMSITAEMNEHMLQNTLNQRKAWRKQYKLRSDQLFSVFSEFTALMKIHRNQILDTRIKTEKIKIPQHHLQQQTAQNLKGSTGQSTLENLHQIFPVADHLSSRKQEELSRSMRNQKFRLNKRDMREFAVQSQVLMDHSDVLRPTKPGLRVIVMRACGIHSAGKEKSSVDYEQFLAMSSLLKYWKGSQEQYIDFAVRLFDPTWCGFCTNGQFDTVVDLLFANEEDEELDDAGDSQSNQQNDQELQQSQNIDGIKLGADDKKKMGSTQNSLSQTKNNSVSVSGKDNDPLNTTITSAHKMKDGKQDSSTGDLKSHISKQEQKLQDDQRGDTRVDNGNTPSDSLGGKKDESVASNLKRKCRELSILKPGGFLNPDALKKAFEDAILDIEDFKSAFK